MRFVVPYRRRQKRFGSDESPPSRVAQLPENTENSRFEELHFAINAI